MKRPALFGTGRFAAVAAALLVATAAAHAASSVSHQGITWTFSADRPTGTFANGEPWVIGPVTVTHIDPNPSQSTSGTQHGSMVNPVPGAKHGFDSNPSTEAKTAYDASLNVALSLPVNLVAGDVLVSSKTGGSYPNFVERVCVLTVLATAPPEGSFRPGPYGRDRTVRWNKKDIDYSVLRNLAPVSGTPTKAQIEDLLPPLPWWEWSMHYTGNLLCPWRNVATNIVSSGVPSTYGRDIAVKWGNVGLWLNLNHSQADKEKAMIQSIQCGIDIWSYATNGGGFYHDGGHKCGRKFPVLLAAVALNDATLLSFASNPDIFQEDTQTFIVTQSDVGRSVVAPKEPYNQSHVGMGEWGVRHRWEPNQDDSRWSEPAYRNVVWPAMVGPVLAAELMGKKAQWGHPAIFVYTERYISRSGVHGFVGNMWNTHRSTATPAPSQVSSPVISPAGGAFEAPQTVSISSATPGATIHFTVNGSAPTTSSPVYSAPFVVNSTTTVRALAVASGMTASGVSSADFSYRVATPTISPVGGTYSASVTVGISTATQGATIYYTTDGSDAGRSSTLYTQPFTLAESATVKAIAIKANLGDSAQTEAVFSIEDFVSSTDWANVNIGENAGKVAFTFEATPKGNNIDSLVGFAGTKDAAAFADLACIIRFNPSGFIDARDGGNYRALVEVPYTQGRSYKFDVVVDTENKTYSVGVTPAGGERVLIADGFSFRTEQAELSTIGRLSYVSVTGEHSMSDFEVIRPPSAPRGVRIVPEGE